MNLPKRFHGDIIMLNIMSDTMYILQRPARYLIGAKPIRSPIKNKDPSVK